jgi:hypothetical protein
MDMLPHRHVIPIPSQPVFEGLREDYVANWIYPHKIIKYYYYLLFLLNAACLTEKHANHYTNDVFYSHLRWYHTLQVKFDLLV